MTPKLRVLDIAIAERPVLFRQPFRFGAATVNQANELLVCADIEVEGGARARGVTAELMVPKWFCKAPVLSVDDTVAQLRRSVALARQAYRAHDRFETAFGLHAACYGPVIAGCAAERIPPLAGAFGPAELDKAVLDALLRALQLDVFEGLRRNVVGLNTQLTPDLTDATIGNFLAQRQPSASLAVRHTVGLTDDPAAVARTVVDGAIRYLKVKLSGDLSSDRARWIEIVKALAPLRVDYRLTLDANEQFADQAALAGLVDALLNDEAFEDVAQRLIYIEQPLPRDLTWARPLGAPGKSFAFIIDEADDGYDAFPRALGLGYRGVSSKSCKGFYKSLLNGARSAQWNADGSARTFITAEDLTCQAGLAVQQDMALAAFHGIVHSERNGHHYGDGFNCTPQAESHAFLAAHPDLYEMSGGQVRLIIRNGAVSTGSLTQPGFANGVDPAAITPFSKPSATSVREYGT